MKQISKGHSEKEMFYYVATFNQPRSINNETLPFMLPIHGVITSDKGGWGLKQESHVPR